MSELSLNNSYVLCILLLIHTHFLHISCCINTFTSVKDLKISSTAEKYQTKKHQKLYYIFFHVVPNLTTAAGVISLHSVFSSVSFGW